MLSLNVDTNYRLDLQDDIYSNYTLNLYEFIGDDPVRAFYFGGLIKKIFPELGQERQLLYSKQLRHSSDDLSKYKTQFDFWASKFPKDNEIDMIEFSEYLLNNMFYDKESDIINLALFLGSKIELSNDQI